MAAFGCGNGENEADVWTNRWTGEEVEADTVGGSEGVFGMVATTQCTEGRCAIVVVLVE